MYVYEERKAINQLYLMKFKLFNWTIIYLSIGTFLKVYLCLV